MCEMRARARLDLLRQSTRGQLRSFVLRCVSAGVKLGGIGSVLSVGERIGRRTGGAIRSGGPGPLPVGVGPRRWGWRRPPRKWTDGAWPTRERIKPRAGLSQFVPRRASRL